MASKAFDRTIWDVRHVGTDVRYVCRACPGGRLRDYRNLKPHEASEAHKLALKVFKQTTANETGPSLPSSSTSIPRSGISRSDDPQLYPGTSDEILVDDALRSLLVSATVNPNQPLYPAGHPRLAEEMRNSPPPATAPSPITGIEWGLFADEITLEESPLHRAAAQTAQLTLDLMNGKDFSDDDDEPDERPDAEAQNGFDEDDTEDLLAGIPQPKRARSSATDKKESRDWFPWEDKITCTLDILMHLPCSVFSHKQLDLFLWILSVNGVADVPSVKQMKKINSILQNMCGIGTRVYEGVLGHRYYMNSLSDILAQETANPRVRPHLHFYPEDSGNERQEARQSDRWLKELRAEDTTPMIRTSMGVNYYIYEPAMLADGTCCVPIRWFTKQGTTGLHGLAWRMRPVQRHSDSEWGWQVREDEEIAISEARLLKNFEHLRTDATLYGLPDPSRIFEVVKNGADGIETEEWTYTDPTKGNEWREKAQGRRVFSVPLWMYCDDTSGNLSKKWNEHNSFLFTMAGLPGEETSREYNVHFLSTSNIAPPLEMLDGVVDQLSEAQKNGIPAWDCELQEQILIFPVVLALLGDNPMQSEFACHIGLQAKYFCRVCYVKGSDAMDDTIAREANIQRVDEEPGSGSEASRGGDESRDDESEAGSASEVPKKKKKGKFKESLQSMVNRVRAFMKVGEPRNKKASTEKLRSYFSYAKTPNTKTKLRQMRTESGVKDTVQEHFFERLFTSYKGKQGVPAKQEALDAAVSKLPDDITSPVWRIKGLDPHQDTPVEILHVVLLGFVKYFWRDLTQNRLKGKDDRKALLAQRLSSFDVSGLGISPISGETLVNYAGSLTGRDFRIIAQVAPFVVYDMVSPEILEAWISLSKLVPMIWQPKIQDIDEYEAILKTRIQDFLVRTARWSAAWFNKPKFHILLHLPSHIRRFGPAILFATEAFESFNAVIRAKSVHSNRQAPSRDIALAFAQGNRIRHLMSGGFFVPVHTPPKQSTTSATSNTVPRPANPTPPPLSALDYVSIGPGPVGLMAVSNTATAYLGLVPKKPILPGQCSLTQDSLRAFSRTLAFSRISNHGVEPLRHCHTCKDVVLVNGDVCSPGLYVLVNNAPHSTFVGCVREILQLKGSGNQLDGRADAVLIQTCDISSDSPTYRMPHISLLDSWSLVPIESLLCTVNVQHNCVTHRCAATGFRPVFQERTRTAQQSPVVQHIGDVNDAILNVGQMRDAVHLQKHNRTMQPLDSEAIIHASCAAQIETNKKVAVQKAAGSGKQTKSRSLLAQAIKQT